MTTRRKLLKTAGALIVTAPVIGFTSGVFADEVNGTTTLKELDEKTVRGPGLKRWIEEWIYRIIKRSKNPEEALDSYKKNSKEMNAEIDKLVKQIQGGGVPDEIIAKPLRIKIKLSFEFPPAKLKLEVTF